MTYGDTTCNVVGTMDNQIPNDDSLDSLLDAESDLEFGDPEFGDRLFHQADERKAANLRQWTAEDFASIHVRFRPHLERHARRYLSNSLQAEEVVQEAFLYLMTALPEIDNELGVLKFLKWKVRLLCFDVLRHSSRAKEVSVAHDLEQSSDQDLLADFEREEDNAVIRLALSRLNPRHREALIASVYQDKSASQIGNQIGLSENATRQLLFRAKKAFRLALVGEAEIAGKSLAEVLSIATKKAVLDGKRGSIVVGSLVIVVAMGMGLSSIPNMGEDATIAANEGVTSTDELSLATSPFVETEELLPSNLEPESAQRDSVQASPADAKSINAPVTLETEQTLADEGGVAKANLALEESSSSSNGVKSAELMEEMSSVQSILATDVSAAGFYNDGFFGNFGVFFNGVTVEVFGGTGLSAFVDLDADSREASQMVLDFWIGQEKYFAVPQSLVSSSTIVEDRHELDLEASNFYIVKTDGTVISESPFASATVVVNLELDSNGLPNFASLRVDR